MVAGRFLQGVGGGGLVPATLALVADLYPVERRGVPLGVVSAVQELGSVLGPLFGALVLSVADWRDDLLINLAVGLVLAAALRGLGGWPRRTRSGPEKRGPDRLGLGPCCCSCWSRWSPGPSCSSSPASWSRDLTWGELFIPFAGDGRWPTPVGVVAVVALPAVRGPVRDGHAGRWSTCAGWGRSAREADLRRRALLAVALGGVILAFATADPQVQVFSDRGLWYLLGGAVGAVAFGAAPAPRRAPLSRAAPCACAGMGRARWSASSSAPR